MTQLYFVGDTSGSIKCFYQELVARVPFYANVVALKALETEISVKFFPSKLNKILPEYLRKNRNYKVDVIDLIRSETKKADLSTIAAALDLPELDTLFDLNDELQDVHIGNFHHSGLYSKSHDFVSVGRNLTRQSHFLGLVIAFMGLNKRLLDLKRSEKENSTDGEWIRDVLAIMVENVGELVYVAAENDVVAVPSSVIAFVGEFEEIPEIIKQSNYVKLVDFTDVPLSSLQTQYE